VGSTGDSALFAGRDLVCVHRGTDPIEANLLQGLLDSEGIPAAVTGADLVGGYSGVPRVCDVRLLVPQRYREQAAGVLERYQHERPGSGEWACGGCGEANAATFESCWSCGRDAAGEARS
jgi:hypothetical protein